MKKGIRWIVIGMAFLMCATMLTACGSANKPQATAKEKFTVGMECDYAPYNWTQTDDSNGAVPIATGGYANGYDVQMALKIANALGRELVVQKTEWTGLIPALQSGKIDAIIAGMSPTSDRKLTVDFTDPYYTSDLVIVVRKDGKYASATSLADFKGAKITGQIDTLHYTVIDQITGVKKQNAMETFPAMIVALTSGKIDGYISERPGALSAIANNPSLAFVGFTGTNGFTVSDEDVMISVAMRKGNSDITAINGILAKITTKDRSDLMDWAVAHQPK